MLSARDKTVSVLAQQCHPKQIHS